MLNRFLAAQEHTYAQALAEMQAGKKQTHWMWYVFPQLSELGKSETAHYYGIRNQQEAAAFLAHPVLGKRILEITGAVLLHPSKTPLQLFGHPDNLKFHSSVTLFNRVSNAPENPFATALNTFFEGKPDLATVRILDSGR